MTRFALALALALSSGGLASAQTRRARRRITAREPRGARHSRPSLPPALPPRADGVPADLAFGAYQRGNFLYALLEAERRLDGNRTDAAAMTLIGEIYHDGGCGQTNDREASRWYGLASNLGDPQAAYELGVLLLQGRQGRGEGSSRRQGAVRARGGQKPSRRTLQSRGVVLRGGALELLLGAVACPSARHRRPRAAGRRVRRPPAGSSQIARQTIPAGSQGRSADRRLAA